MTNYGKELILDLYDCNSDLFTREDIEKYMIELCELIDMTRADLHFWDYEDSTQEEYDEAPPHLKGTSVVQFIMTSNIVMHALDELGRIYLNIFSCKDFDPEVVVEFTLKYFGGHVKNGAVVDRE